MQNLCKWVKYSLLNSRKWLHVKSTERCAVAHIDTHVSRPADKCCWFHWTVKTDHLYQPDLNPVDYWICGCSSAAGWIVRNSKPYGPSETTPECLLGRDQPVNGARQTDGRTTYSSNTARWFKRNAIVTPNSQIMLLLELDCCVMFYVRGAQLQ